LSKIEVVAAQIETELLVLQVVFGAPIDDSAVEVNQQIRELQLLSLHVEVRLQSAIRLAGNLSASCSKIATAAQVVPSSADRPLTGDCAGDRIAQARDGFEFLEVGIVDLQLHGNRRAFGEAALDQAGISIGADRCWTVLQKHVPDRD